MKLKTSIKGLAEVRRVLDQLPATVEKRVVDNALRAGGRVFRDDVKATSPYRRLRRDVAVKTASRAERDREVNKGDVYVGFAGASSRFAHLPEFGTGPRVQKTTGRQTGQMPVNPTMRPTFDRRKEDALKAAQKSLGVGVEREAKKLAGAKFGDGGE